MLAGPAAYADQPEPETSASASASVEPAAPVDPTEAPAPEPTASAPAGADSAATDTPAAPAAPAVVTEVNAPVIDGDPVVGGTLTSTGGEWDGAAWLHFTWTANGDTVLTESLPVGGKSTLQLMNGLAGATIHLSVVASLDEDGAGIEAGASDVTVGTGTFQNVSWSGAVSGTPKVGLALSVTAPVWNGPFGMRANIGYQWYRGTAAIAGATGAGYTAAAADSGQLLSVKTTLSLSGYTPLVLSSKQLSVAAGTFTTAPVPTISGTARVGQVQSANAGNWAPTGAALSYQWYRGTAAIAGATARTYTAAAADNGKALKVRVRATKAGFVTAEKYSAARTIAAGVFTATKNVTITGTARFGQTLRTSQGWSPAPTSTSYQWYSNGKAIRGGTYSFLNLSSSLIGTKITVKVTVAKAGFTSKATFSAATVVRNAVFTTVTAPKITGTLKAGSVLTASNGSYKPGPSSVSFQWYRNGAAISGARNRTYKLASADNGKSITVRVTARKQYYDAKVVASGAVAVPMPPVIAIKGDGTYRVGSGLKPGLYKATGAGNSCYWERLSGFSGSLSQIKANYFGPAHTYVQISAGDVGFHTSGCGSWTTVTSTGAKATRITADGTYRVGVDVLPGTYYASGSGNSCYAAILSGFGGSLDEIIDNYYGSAQIIVEIPSYAKGFTIQRCGTLTRY
ncbi:hypothetical protein AL755_21260 [Arthrobacter sp. ERGS1:01]|nr:hypothetical protein AL755_21260 [Arthrobacter sp. ERGS1:01]